jgi:CRP-like cAMP-binding protein
LICDEGQFDGGAMFFIISGDCVVQFNKEFTPDLPLLVEGDHFGELSLLYRCRRQATIIARYYNSVARLEPDKYRYLESTYP